MSEVVKLQLIGLSVVGIGIVILLFVRAQFVRVIGFVAIVLGLFSLVALAVPQMASLPPAERKVRYCDHQDTDGYGGHRAEDFLQQGPMRALSFHRSQRIRPLPGS
jgi:hypothetical protein